MLNKPFKKILILSDDQGIETAILKAKTLKGQPCCLVWQITNISLPFKPAPSKILLPHFPTHVTAAIPLLEDYRIASRLCGIDAPGFWEGSMANLLQEFGKTILPAYEEVLIYGNEEFIYHCKLYAGPLARTFKF